MDREKIKKEKLPRYEPPERPAVQMGVHCRLDINEMSQDLSPEQTRAVMTGIGQVINAQKG